MSKYNRLPLKYVAITTPFGKDNNRYHYGVDLGWSSTEGGPNVEVYSANDGIVIGKGFNSSAGNYIWVQTDKDGVRYLHRYLHLNKASTLKINDKVKQGDKIGNMGTTGDSTGPHLHFEVWKCPLNYKFNWNDRKKYVVNPMNYFYLFEDQKTNTKTSSKVIRVVGQKVKKKKDTSKNQIEVIKEKLRCRKNYGLTSSVLGYIDYGIYDVLETKEKDNYKWHKIGDNMWIAETEETKYYKKEDPKEEPKEEINKETNKDSEQLIKFIAPKDGYYYIYLKKDEYLYYLK